MAMKNTIHERVLERLGRLNEVPKDLHESVSPGGDSDSRVLTLLH